MSKRVLVVGGGVIGVSCAYFLLKDGWNVRVVDRGAIGGGSSAGNCGLVCPSHVLPLTEPGMVAQGLATFFQRNSPLKIKPRFDLALWAWLLHFARRCNERDMMDAARGIQPILDRSIELYRRIISEESLDCEWRERGLLYVYLNTRSFDSYAAVNALLSDSFQHPAERFDGDAVLEVEPALKSGLAGGWYYRDDAHLRPDKLMSSLRSKVEALGGSFHPNRPFLGFVRRDGAAVAARTSEGDIEADAFVFAAGAWSPMLNDGLGCKIPIQPGKGYSLTTTRPSICPDVPLIFPETRVAVTPFQSGYRLGSTMEFAGYDETIPPSRLQLLREGAAPFLLEPTTQPIEQTWFGWRPMTWDGLPIIDRAPALANVVIAAGHNMLGLSMATATGELVAERLGERSTTLDPKPYRATRF